MQKMSLKTYDFLVLTIWVWFSNCKLCWSQ